MSVKRFSTNHEENLKRHQEEAAVSRRTSMDGLHGQRAEEHEACGLHPDSHHKHHRLQLEGSSQGEEGGGPPHPSNIYLHPKPAEPPRLLVSD